MSNTSSDSKLSKSTPRIALVLGSGGVRSAAALGIADVLTRAGLAPDLIVGCSSGALLGAPIALGLSGVEGLAMATRLWSQDLTQKRRWQAFPQLIAPKLLGFNADFSLRDAGRIEERIYEAFGVTRLESLPIPLRVVTTDAASGESVVLTQGYVAEALRASIALPFIFPSVEIGGRRLVDGVVSNPLPVSVAQDAQVVIALGFRGVMPRRIDRPSRLFAQASTAIINNLQATHLKAAVAAGQRIVNIDLPLDRRIGLWQTDAIPRIFAAGRRAAEKRLDDIHAALNANAKQVAA
jgi:NTE family protein